MPVKRLVSHNLNKPQKSKAKRTASKATIKKSPIKRASGISKKRKQRAHSEALARSHAARSYNSLKMRFDDFYGFIKKRKKSGKDIGLIQKGRNSECPIKYFEEFTNGNFPKNTSKKYFDIFNYRCDNKKVWDSYLASRRSSKRISSLVESNKNLELTLSTYKKKPHPYYYKSTIELKRFINLKIAARIEESIKRKAVEEILIDLLILILQDEKIYNLFFTRKNDHSQRIARNELVKALLNPQIDLG